MDNTMRTLTVRDQFESFQGTGLLSGTWQHFLRLAGCGVKCPLRANCDQPEALSRSEGQEVSIRDITDNVSADWLHITGGEPVEHNHLPELVSAAIHSGKQVHVQTSGSIHINWITRPFVSVSPKQREILVRPSEIILIAAKWMTDGFAKEVTAGHDCPVFIVPEATNKSFSPQRAIELTHTLREHGIDSRLGLQSHLLWEVP
jgi:organic radical activating enzyme